MEGIKHYIKKIPLISRIAVSVKKKLFPLTEFTTSEEFWINRYKRGENSGAGSYNNLAEFKADVINEFVSDNSIESIIELGCGDGNQIKYFKFPSYIGFDISPIAIEKCKEEFKMDKSKHFFHMNQISNHKADLVFSLDVIYHLIEDETYHQYMNQLFDLTNLYVIIYACDIKDTHKYAPHIKTRKFTDWVINNKQDFQLVEHIPNKYPLEEGKGSTTSFSDFYIYKRIR